MSETTISAKDFSFRNNFGKFDDNPSLFLKNFKNSSIL